jgi:hypothetical protein
MLDYNGVSRRLQDMVKSRKWVSCKVFHFCLTLSKAGMNRQILAKVPMTKFHENPYGGNKTVPND